MYEEEVRKILVETHAMLIPGYSPDYVAKVICQLSQSDLIKWAEDHYWGSLEKDRNLIIRHLKSYKGE